MNYLIQWITRKICIIRIIDSRSEQFKLSKVYNCQVDVINVITAPEIEMLVIVSQGKYRDYCRSGINKPSDYCKCVLKISDVKSPDYISNYFSDSNKLVEAIKKYNGLHKRKNKEVTIYDLLK